MGHSAFGAGVEELNVLHAKLWNLRSAVEALKDEVLLAKAPAALGLVEGNREKRNRSDGYAP